MNVGKDLSDLYTAVHNDIVPTQESIEKVAKSFLELLQSVGFFHTAIGDFEKEKIDSMINVISQKDRGQGAGEEVDLTKVLIECELDHCHITSESNLTNTGLLNAMGWHNNNHGLRVI